MPGRSAGTSKKSPGKGGVAAGGADCEACCCFAG